MSFFNCIRLVWPGRCGYRHACTVADWAKCIPTISAMPVPGPVGQSSPDILSARAKAQGGLYIVFVDHFCLARLNFLSPTDHSLYPVHLQYHTANYGGIYEIKWWAVNRQLLFVMRRRIFVMKLPGR